MCITKYSHVLHPSFTRRYWGKNQWQCVWRWASVIDCDVCRRQGMIAVRRASTPCGDSAPWDSHTLNLCIQSRFHNAFGEDWSSLKWCWFWWGLDPHSSVGRWWCRKSTLDSPIAELDLRVGERHSYPCWDHHRPLLIVSMTWIRSDSTSQRRLCSMSWSVP